MKAEEEDFQGSARCQVSRFQVDASLSDAAAALLAFFIPRVGAVLRFRVSPVSLSPDTQQHHASPRGAWS